MSNVMERELLTMLVWALLLEIFVLYYFISSSKTWRFEFQYTVFLFIITFIGIILVILRIYRRLRPLPYP